MSYRYGSLSPSEAATRRSSRRQSPPREPRRLSLPKAFELLALLSQLCLHLKPFGVWSEIARLNFEMNASSESFHRCAPRCWGGMLVALRTCSRLTWRVVAHSLRVDHRYWAFSERKHAPHRVWVQLAPEHQCTSNGNTSQTTPIHGGTHFPQHIPHTQALQATHPGPPMHPAVAPNSQQRSILPQPARQDSDAGPATNRSLLRRAKLPCWYYYPNSKNVCELGTSLSPEDPSERALEYDFRFNAVPTSIIGRLCPLC